MNNRKARLLLQVPASRSGFMKLYNISNTRRLAVVGDMHIAFKRSTKTGVTVTGRRVAPFIPSIHNLPARATGDDLLRLRRMFAEMPRYAGGIVKYTKDI